MTTASTKLQLGTAALVLAATAVTVTPAIAPTVSHAEVPALTRPASVLSWGVDQLDSALAAQFNTGPRAAAAASATPGASAVGASATPAELLQYLVVGIATGIRGIVRGSVVIVGTTTYVALAFTGGVITTVRNFLPGWIGDVTVKLGGNVTNVANEFAQAIHVGPYATSSV